MKLSILIAITVFFCISCTTIKNKGCNCFTIQETEGQQVVYPDADYQIDGVWFVNVSGDTLRY
jgi:hypothetical protein